MELTYEHFEMIRVSMQQMSFLFVTGLLTGIHS